MIESLKSHFDKLETQRQTLTSEIEHLSSDKFNLSRNNKWSVSEILSHLIKAEVMSINYINKKINAINEVGNSGLWGEIKLIVFIISQRLPLKYKAPKTLGDKPKPYENVQEMTDDWSTARTELKKLLEKFSVDQLKKKIYRHPVMGRCNIVDALIFFREHIIHHHPQIKRQL